MKNTGIRKENDNLRINELRLKEEIKNLLDEKEALTKLLRLHGVVVSLPKFKKGQTLKRPSKYTTDFTEIKVKLVNALKNDYRYLSMNGVWYSEKELLAY
jgi:hypothetical protein